MKSIILFQALFFFTFHAFGQRTRIVLDYDAADEVAASNAGGDYLREFWSLNANLPDDPLVMGLTWAVVKFDTLFDADSSFAYTYADKAIRVDSIRLFFMHENVSGTPDTLVISVYQYEGVNGIMIDSQEQVANAVLFETTIISTGLSDSFQIDQMTVYPGLQLLQGEKFLVGIHFRGDLSNTFNLLSGYADYCGAACFGAPSAFVDNSYYRIIYWDVIRFTGVNTLVYDCDGDLNAGEAGECELSTIQNLIIKAYVSFEDTGTPIHEEPEAPSIKIYPNPMEDFVMVDFSEPHAPVQISLYDSRGKMIFVKNPVSREKLNLSALSSGLYLMRLTGSHESVVVKLVKK